MIIEWRTINGCSNYEVSMEGEVRNKTTRKILKGHLSNGYRYYALRTDTGNIVNKGGHRLVMETFKPCDNMQNLEVNHIDRVRDNNFIKNLEWVTHDENIAWVWQLDNPNISMNKRRVRVDYLDGHSEIYTGTQQCSEYLKISREEIGRYIREPFIEARTIPAYFYYEDIGLQEPAIKVDYLDGRTEYYHTRLDCSRALDILPRSIGVYVQNPCGTSRKVQANFSFITQQEYAALSNT